MFSIAKKMSKLCCVICGKNKKFENRKILYLLEKTLVLSIICNKCKNKDEKLFKEEESIEMLKILGLIENIFLLWNINQNIHWKKMNKTKNYLIEEVNRNDLMSKNHKNVCTTDKLYWTLSCFIFCNYWMCFHFFFCFFNWYSYRNGKFVQ